MLSLFDLEMGLTELFVERYFASTEIDPKTQLLAFRKVLGKRFAKIKTSVPPKIVPAEGTIFCN